MEAVLLVLGVVMFFVGLGKMGFAAGLAWFIGLVLLAIVVWPLAIVAGLAIAAYGLLKFVSEDLKRPSLPGAVRASSFVIVMAVLGAVVGMIAAGYPRSIWSSGDLVGQVTQVKPEPQWSTITTGSGKPAR